MKKRMISLLVAVFLITASLSLLKAVPVYAKKKPVLNKKSATITVGGKLKLKVKNTKKKVKWKSSKKAVASVNKKGVVVAKKAGKCVITAKVAGKKLKCKITVKAKPNLTINDIAAYGWLIVNKYSAEKCGNQSPILLQINKAGGSAVCIKWKYGFLPVYTIIEVVQGMPTYPYGIVVKEIKNKHIYGGGGTTFGDLEDVKKYYSIGGELNIQTIRNMVEKYKKNSNWYFY